MKDVINSGVLKLLQMAKKQEDDVRFLFLLPTIYHDTELQIDVAATASAVVKSLEEVMNPARTANFQKNFLVIAKSFNSHYRLLLQQCFEQETIGFEKYNEEQRKNQQLQDKLISVIEQLQQQHGLYQLV